MSPSFKLLTDHAANANEGLASAAELVQGEASTKSYCKTPAVDDNLDLSLSCSVRHARLVEDLRQVVSEFGISAAHIDGRRNFLKE